MHVTYIQVEATTKCNAWCPGCARSNGGYQLVPGLVLEDLAESRFQEVLEQLTGLEIIDFCGTYGDAIAAKNILPLVDIARQHCEKIIIRTNGSLRSTEWWTEFGSLLKDFPHEVWFCLDGLEDTHAIYRQATDFNKIINNAKAFMSSGGVAVWQFIPWAHNQHQIKDCIKLSQQLGFSRFEFVKDVRTEFDAKDYTTGSPVKIIKWDDNKKFSKYEKVRNTLTFNDCRHLSQPSLYLNANGSISNCCFFNTLISADKIEKLPNIALELDRPRALCLRYCGK